MIEVLTRSIPKGFEIGSIVCAKKRIELGNDQRYVKDRPVEITPYNQKWLITNYDLFYVKD